MQLQPRYKKGEKIGGRYLVHQALTGGMGEVYLCLDVKENFPLALKTFQARYLTNQKLRPAFESEAATWVALEKHPNIVHCYYMDMIDNHPFLLLEWIASDESHGTDLRSWLGHGPLDVRLALDFAIDICRGLIHAGQKQPGLVHRDLKPDNVLVAQGRIAKITDFGLAKMVKDAALALPSLTSGPDGRQHTSNMAGTPPYMAPEQWRGEVLDLRTDIYAVGCILFEMLTGRLPFAAETLNGLRTLHLEAELPELTRVETLPTLLNPLLARCLAKRRERRFASVDALLERLSQIYQQQFTQAPRAVPVGQDFTAVDYNNRGKTYVELRRYDDALTNFAQALGIDPSFRQAYSNRGNTYQALGRYDQALADYAQALSIDPNDAEVYYNRGTNYAHLGRYDEALADFSQALRIDPNLALAYYDRGLVYYALRRYEEALADYTQALCIDPADAKAYSNRGLTYHNLRRYEEALADYTEALRIDANDAQAYYKRGNAYHELRRYEEALADYSQALRIDSNYASAYSNRGVTYYVLRRYHEALADYTQALRIDPNDADVYGSRGNAYHQLRRYEEALADYSQALRIDPNNALACRNIGVIHANRGDWRTAFPYFEKAAQLGDSAGVEYAARAREILGIAPATQSEPAQQAFEAFQQANAKDEMRQAVAQFQSLLDPGFMAAIEQVVGQQVPANLKPAFEQRLAWLREIANEQ